MRSASMLMIMHKNWVLILKLIYQRMPYFVVESAAAAAEEELQKVKRLESW